MLFSNEDENVSGSSSLRSGDALAFFPTQICKLRKIVRESSINLLQIYLTVFDDGRQKAVACSYKTVISLICLLSLCTYDVNDI